MATQTWPTYTPYGSLHIRIARTTNKSRLSRFAIVLYGLFVIYTVIPYKFFSVFGLSPVAPLMFFIGLEALLGPRRITPRYRHIWVLLGLAFWSGLVCSLLINVGWGTASLDMELVKSLIRWAYWIVVFVVVATVTADLREARLTAVLSGLAVIALAGLRTQEAFASGGWGLHGGLYGGGAPPVLFTKNMYGLQLSTFTLFTLVLLFNSPYNTRMFMLLGFGMLLVAILGNGSRAGWVALAVGAGIFLLSYLVTNPQKWLPVIFLILIVLLSFQTLVSAAGMGDVIDYQMNSFDDIENDESYAFRQVMVEKARKVFYDNVGVGVGLGHFTKTYVADLTIPDVLAKKKADIANFTDKSAHNSYMFLLAETGLVGTIPFAIILIVLAVGGMNAVLRLARAKELWALAVYGSFLAMSIHLWNLSGLGSTGPWFIYGFVAGMIECSAALDDTPKPTKHAVSPPTNRAASPSG